jgi:hypothetical protein
MDFVPCASLFVSFSFSSMFVYSPRIVIPHAEGGGGEWGGVEAGGLGGR